MPNTAVLRHSPPRESDPLEPLYTKAEVADILNVSRRFVERITTEHRIRFVRIGRHVRIPESAVRDFVERGTSPVSSS
jgi:excisionase family DNA binding protein